MDTQQIITSNYRVPFDLQNDIKTRSKESSKDQLIENLEESSLMGANIFPVMDWDIEDLRSLQFFITDEYPTYLFDYSLPSEINIEGFTLRFGDLKVDHIKKTRLALALATASLSTAMIVGLLTLPPPYNLASLALCGPLFVSTYGLVTQK